MTFLKFNNLFYLPKNKRQVLMNGILKYTFKIILREILIILYLYYYFCNKLNRIVQYNKLLFLCKKDLRIWVGQNRKSKNISVAQFYF